MKKAHKYECSNWFNDYSSQRYPTYINSVKFAEITGKKTPDGMLCVSIETVDGHCCSLLKCYKTVKGERYCIFGKHRLHEGFRGPVILSSVPYGVRKAIEGCGAELSE